MAKSARPVANVVVVGAGFGGLQAVKALAREPVHITLVDRSNHHLFQPLLYQVATAELSPADIAYPIRSIFNRQANVDVVMGEVVGVDAAAKQLKLADRTLPYDYLVLSTGAGHSYFGHDEWAAYAPGLKNLIDATKIRERVLSAFELAETESDPEARKSLLQFVLVGGGPTGVEMAGAIAELAYRALSGDFRHLDPRSARVTLVEAGPRVLAAFAEDLSAKAKRQLERLGVDVRTDARVEKIDADGVWIGGSQLASRNVIWTAGVQASAAGKWLGAECDRAGRVRVGPDLSVPKIPNVFVIGDTACALDANGRPLPGVAPVAMQQGRYVARVLARRVNGGESPKPFRYVDKGSLAVIGRSAGVGDLGHGIHVSGWLAWNAWLLIHIYFLVGFRNRVLVLIQWAYDYFTFKRGTRLILPPWPPAGLDPHRLPCKNTTTPAQKPGASGSDSPS